MSAPRVVYVAPAVELAAAADAKDDGAPAATPAAVGTVGRAGPPEGASGAGLVVASAGATNREALAREGDPAAVSMSLGTT